MSGARPICLAPCVKCPWRAEFKGDDDYLRPGRRAGIMRELLADGQFPCHETIDHADAESDDLEVHDNVDYSKAMECAGSSLVLLRAGRDTQMLRIMERIGMVDLEALEARNAGIELWTLREALDEVHNLRLDDEGEEDEGTCNVVNSGCEAPAGYMIGGEAVRGDDMVDTVCPVCGEYVCDNCSDDEGRCLNGMCSDEEEDDDYDY